MKRSVCLAIMSMILSSIPVTSYGWTHIYGIPGEDAGYWVEQTADEGYVIAGETLPYGDTTSSMWLLKTDAAGDTTWTRKYKRYDGDEYSSCVQVTGDGGYVVTGVPWTLLKTDAWGDTLWTRDFDRPSGECVRQTKEGGYAILTGGARFIKTDEHGDSIWTRVYESNLLSLAHQTSDGGYIMAGSKMSGDYPRSYVYLLKTDSLGDSLWSKAWGFDEDYSYARGSFIQETDDGGYVIVGSANEPHQEEDLWLIKTDALGDTLWSRIYGGEVEDLGYCVQQTTGGGYVISGRTGNDIWLLKTDDQGDTIWTVAYEHGVAYNIRETQDGGYIIAGKNSQDLWLLKTNEYGDTVWYEGEPREVLVPAADTLVDTIIPQAWFKNSGTYPIEDFYCDCEIVPKVSSSLASLSPPYHCRYLISYPLEPGDSVLVEFAEWFSDDSSRCVARFYTSKDSEPIWQTREKIVEFFGVPDVGITEEAPAILPPSCEVVSSFGREVILKYSNYPKGFYASVYDASGRKVDELHSTERSGMIVWGERYGRYGCYGCYGSGVYFIRTDLEKGASRVVILR